MLARLIALPFALVLLAAAALPAQAQEYPARPVRLVVAFAAALHVVQVTGLESLVVHEGTHVLAAEAWGPAGTPLLGEGLAVWASGSYAGVPLAEWRKKVQRRAIRDLLGPQFRKLPEGEASEDEETVSPVEAAAPAASAGEAPEAEAATPASSESEEPTAEGNGATGPEAPEEG